LPSIESFFTLTLIGFRIPEEKKKRFNR